MHILQYKSAKVWNFNEQFWNFVQNFETIHRKICILLSYGMWFTISLICGMSLSETIPRSAKYYLKSLMTGRIINTDMFNFVFSIVRADSGARSSADTVMTKFWYRLYHDDVIKWKHFPRYWPFVWGIHRSSGNSPHKSKCRGALIFSWSAHELTVE